MCLFSGCATLSISQSSLQGDLARGETSRVAIALGLVRGMPSITGVPRPEWINRDIVSLTGGASSYERSKLKDLKKLMYAYMAEVETRICVLVPPDEKKNEQLCASAQKVKSLIGVQSFDQIEINAIDWKEINPVSVFGGLGKTEFVIVRDDGGNYNLKSASFDPNEVVQAGIDAGLGALRIVAAAYGLPPGVIGPSSTKHAGSSSASALTSPDKTSRTKEISSTVHSLDGAAKRLAAELKNVASALGAGASPVDSSSISRLKVAGESYLYAVSSTARGVRGLEGLARLLPEVDVATQLAQQFNVSSLSQKEQVGLYWVYLIGLDNPQEEALAIKTLGNLNVQIVSRHVQPQTGRNDALIRSALTDLNQIISLEQASHDTRQAIVALLDAQAYVNNAKTPFEQAYPELKAAIDNLAAQTVNNDDDAKSLATSAQQAVDNYGKKRVSFARLQEQLQLIKQQSDFTKSEETTLQGIETDLAKQNSLMDNLADIIRKHLDGSPLDTKKAKALQEEVKTLALPAAAVTWPQNVLLTKAVREVRIP